MLRSHKIGHLFTNVTCYDCLYYVMYSDDHKWQFYKSSLMSIKVCLQYDLLFTKSSTHVFLCLYVNIPSEKRYGWKVGWSRIDLAIKARLE